ncbi:MAG: hypothetical protein GX887_01140, partial [Firmicutes bacterium]|nr:hypothetical protein [Bacillota bacterium]
MMKKDGGYTFLKTSVVVMLCFVLAFAPVVGEVAPALASAAGKAAGTASGEKSPLNLLGGTASVWGTMLAAASAGEETEDGADDGEISLDGLRDSAGILLEELLGDEQLKMALSEAMVRVADNGGTTLEDIVISILNDEGLRDLLVDLLASYLLLSEGSSERAFFQQITLDLYALLQDNSAGSIKAFLKGALGDLMEQRDMKDLISDIFGVATGRLGGILDDLQEQHVLDEVPDMFKLWWDDFLNKTTGAEAGEAMSKVVVGIMENANVISEDFARALEEDEDYGIAMEHLSDAVVSQLTEPLVDTIKEKLNPFLEAISPPDAGEPDSPNRYAGMNGPLRRFLDTAVMDSECNTCKDNDYPGYIGTTSLTLCPDCPDTLGTVLKRIGADLNANIAEYADAAMGEIIPADAEIEPSDALVKAELGAFLMFWADNLIAIIGRPETGGFLMEPIGDYFATGGGKADLEDILSTLNENFMRTYE